MARKRDESGKLKKAAHYDKKTHSVSFWDGYHRLIDDRLILVRLVGASAAWFLMDFAYYGNTVSSPLVLSALGSDHTILQKTLTQLGIFAAFAAPGYAVAALTMDKLGRKTIQGLGFAMMAVTFGLLALIPNVEKLVVPFILIYGFQLLLYRVRSKCHHLRLSLRDFPCQGAHHGAWHRSGFG